MSCFVALSGIIIASQGIDELHRSTAPGARSNPMRPSELDDTGRDLALDEAYPAAHPAAQSQHCDVETSLPSDSEEARPNMAQVLRSIRQRGCLDHHWPLRATLAKACFVLFREYV